MSSGNESPSDLHSRTSPESASPRHSSIINISSEDLLPLSTIPSSSPQSGKSESDENSGALRRASSISVPRSENFEAGGSATHLETTAEEPPIPSRKASAFSIEALQNFEPDESFGGFHHDESAVPFIITRKASSVPISRSSVQENAAVDTRESGEDDETVLNFSMRVKSRVPVAREGPKKDLREKAYDPTRYRPQVLINDWCEVSQRLELNKGRHLKLQKGPHASAYDWHYQHPFAKKMVDPEECERRMAARNRRLWTYLRDPTEYSDNFNEPFRKK
ncbi:Hypothetical predicted protein [Cloeon dipterum]|uniref:Uncharacterized protein n=1 Tax=Cloeon dipterum TaxID=197152 RepID=A0A8S1DJ83_9INSE|nr:Hypothetical predicted protein [Cloeon dipterum]